MGSGWIRMRGIMPIRLGGVVNFHLAVSVSLLLLLFTGFRGRELRFLLIDTMCDTNKGGAGGEDYVIGDLFGHLSGFWGNLLWWETSWLECTCQ